MSSYYLLNNQHKEILKNWLNSSNIANNKNLNLNLLLKASKDGFKAEIFKRKCHNKSFTLIVVLTSFDKLIGGFTSLPWKDGKFTYITDYSNRTFLFSLTNNKKYLMKNPSYAICHGTDIGPIFGGGSDLEIVNDCNKNYNNFSSIGHTFEFNDSVEDFYGGSKYLVKDYEVYEVKF